MNTVIHSTHVTCNTFVKSLTSSDQMKMHGRTNVAYNGVDEELSMPYMWAFIVKAWLLRDKSCDRSHKNGKHAFPITLLHRSSLRE